MEQWSRAEKELDRIERLDRERRAVEREEKSIGDDEDLRRMLRDESLDSGLFDVPGMQESMRERSAQLEEQMQAGLGRMPRKNSGRYGDLPLRFGKKAQGPIQVETRFPSAPGDSDAWRMAGFREEEFYAGMEKYIGLQNRVKRAQAQFDAMSILAERLEREMGIVATSIRREVREKRKEVERLDRELQTLERENPEVFVGAHLAELRSYRRDLGRGRIADVPYAEEQKRTVMACIRTGTPVFLHGHLGAGKTEVAIAAAREYLAGRSDEEIDSVIEEDLNRWLVAHPNASEAQRAEAREMFAREARGPLVISGSKQTHQSELYGHRTLNVKEFFTDEKVRSLDRAMEAYRQWKANHSDAPEDECAMRKEGLLQAYMDDSSGTFSAFFLGPIYRAMRDGRPIIIDEADYIPPEVLGSLNFMLTRKVGDTVSVQQDSGEKINIKRGFCILMTGNFPSDGEEEIYLGRQQMDAAFLSRLKKIKYEYLPQSTEPNLADAFSVKAIRDKLRGELEGERDLLTPEEFSAKENSLEEEARKMLGSLRTDLFKLLIARTMDRHGNMNVPDESVDKLWKLAVFARKTQDIFSGEFTDDKTGDRGVVRAALGKEVVSLRHIERVLDAWQNDSMRYELDWYIFKEIVEQASGDKERAALYKIAQEAGLFSDTNGWDLSTDIASNAGMVKFSIRPIKKEAGDPVWYSPRDTVRFVFGPEPERTKFPAEGEGGANLAEESEGVRVFIQETEGRIKDLTEELQEYWEDECKGAGDSPRWAEVA